MFDANTINADLNEWRMSGETDLTDMSDDLREAIIREYFEDEPWIIAFALEMQGVHYVTDLDDIERDATDAYQGEWCNLTDYVENLIADVYSESLSNLPDFIRYNIGYEEIGRDMELGGEVETFDTGNSSVHVFNTQW